MASWHEQTERDVLDILRHRELNDEWFGTAAYEDDRDLDYPEEDGDAE